MTIWFSRPTRLARIVAAAAACIAPIALAGVLAPGAAQAEVLYSSFGPGDSFNTQSGTVIAALSDFRVFYGFNFVAPTNAAVDEIDLALSHYTGVNAATVSLWTDGLGAELGSWAISSMPAFGTSFSPEAITGISGIHLTGGLSYALVVQSAEDGYQTWNPSTVAPATPFYQNFLPNGSHVPAAFRIIGTPSAAPEPATWALLLMGFGGLGAVLRRRRVIPGPTVGG